MTARSKHAVTSEWKYVILNCASGPLSDSEFFSIHVVAICFHRFLIVFNMFMNTHVHLTFDLAEVVTIPGQSDPCNISLCGDRLQSTWMRLHHPDKKREREKKSNRSTGSDPSSTTLSWLQDGGVPVWGCTAPVLRSL